MIAIIDYGAGNLRSVGKAIEKVGYPCRVTTNPDEVMAAEAVILPGVGAAGDTMRSLEDLGMAEPIRLTIAQGRPFFGVCMGLQVLFNFSEEGGGQECLGILPGVVRKLPPGLKVPHMGWNQVHRRMVHPLFRGIPDGANFYFVHSFYPEPDASVIAAETDYGFNFCSVIIQGNLVATQFHPEKSGNLGLRLYHNFLRFSLGGKRATEERESEDRGHCR